MIPIKSLGAYLSLTDQGSYSSRRAESEAANEDCLSNRRQENNSKTVDNGKACHNGKRNEPEPKKQFNSHFVRSITLIYKFSNFFYK